jgi:hypothetical protein
MPVGPKGERRPADVIGNAVKVMRIATGEETEDVKSTRSRVTVAREGGIARAKKLPQSKRTEIARAAAKTRWETQAVPSEEEEP